jgi:DNA-binding SARP family transcriptional activator
MTTRKIDGEADLETSGAGEQRNLGPKGSADDDPDALCVHLLGGFRVLVGSRVIDDVEWRLRKAKTLVKLLTLAPGHRLHREQMMDVLWRDLDPEAAGNNLRKTLHVARRALEPSASDTSRYLNMEDGLLALRSPGALWIDVEAFRAAAAEAHRTHDVEAYHAAIELYTGDLLPEDRYEDWAADRREELREEYGALLVELARLHESQDDHTLAIDALRRLVASDPAHEEARVGLMRLYALAGQRHQALRQYQQLWEALRRELGAEPDAASQRLYQEILGGRFPVRVPDSAQPDSMAAYGARRSKQASLVGRDEELDRLEEVLDALFAGQGELVLLGGEAGVGKSRLAMEVAERSARRRAITLRGAAYEQEKQLPYGPFVEALERFAGSMRSDDLRVLSGDAAPELVRLVPPLAAKLGSDRLADSPPDRLRLFTAVAGFLRRLAARAPVVLVLDDLHAADEASLQLLHYLARTGRGSPLLLLGTFRTEEVGPTDPLGLLLADLHRERLSVRLDLSPIGPRENDVLVAALLGGGPCEQTVFEAVYQLAEGNPFYAEEVVQALREGGQLKNTDGRWRLRGEVATVPGPLADPIVVRLKRLARSTQEVLALAAVIGRDSPYRLLREASDLPEAELLDALDECLNRRIFEETAEGYRFGHPLQRAALYERLSRARRASLHGRVAATIETLHGDRLAAHAEALAHHYGLSDEPDRAVPHLIVAGDRAVSVHASEAAIGYYQQALGLLETSERTPGLVGELWEKSGDLWALIGEAGRDVEAYREAIAALQEVPDRLRLARLHRKAAFAHLSWHDADSAEPHLIAAERLLVDSSDVAEKGRLHRAWAHWLRDRRRLDEALEAAKQSLEVAERHGEPSDVVAAHETLAIVFNFSGEWKRGLHFELQRLGAAADDLQLARIFDMHHCIGEYHLYSDTSLESIEEYARSTLELANRMGARRAQAFAWCLLGESLLLRGFWNEAEGCLKRSAELIGELGTRAALPWQRLAELAVYRGDAAAAEEYLRQGMTIATVSPMAPHLWGRLYATATLNALERGDPRAAIRAVEAAAEAATRYGDCQACGALLYPVAAEAYSALGDLPKAEEHARSAEEVAGFWGESAAWKAMAETAQASLALARGDWGHALSRFLAAADLYEQAGQPFWVARCLFEAGLVRARRGEWVESRDLLERAMTTFRRLGAARAEERARCELAQLAG